MSKLENWTIQFGAIRHRICPPFANYAIFTFAQPTPYCWICDAPVPQEIMDAAMLAGVMPTYKTYGLEIPEQKEAATKLLLDTMK